MKIKHKKPYKPLVQMPWCCAACAILWVLHRKGYWVDQEVIAKEIKIKIPAKEKNKFTVKLKTCRKEEDCGAPNIIGKEYNLINKFFKKHKIPFKHTPYKISKIKDVKQFIIDNLKKENDIMFSFCWRGLGKPWNWGHVVLLSEFDTKTNEILIGDPSPKHPKFWKAKLDKITHAMLPKWDKEERGFYIFSRE